MAAGFPAALRLLDKQQRSRGVITLRKQEDDEIAKMKTDPSYKSPLAFLRDERFAELAERIPRLQSLIQFQTLERHHRAFEHCIRTSFSNQEGYRTSDNVYFGTIVSPTFNASVMHLPEDDEYLITLSETFWEGLRYTSDIFAAPLQLKSHDYGFEIDYAVAEHHADRFGEIFRRIVNGEHLYGIDIQPSTGKDRTWRILWAGLHEAMEAFAFGHEYAHFVRRHGFALSNTVATQWAHEYDADRVALDLLVMAQDRKEVEVGGPLALLIRLLGCFLVFKTFMLVEEFSFNLASPSDSHPPTVLRFLMFRRVCFEQLGPQGLAALDKYIASVDELTDFYMRITASAVVYGSLEAKTLAIRVERAFQKAALWAASQYNYQDMCALLDGIYGRMEHEERVQDESKEQDDWDLFSFRSLSSLLAYPVLSLEGAEVMLRRSLGLLDKNQVLRVVKTCRDIYEVAVSVRDWFEK